LPHKLAERMYYTCLRKKYYRSEEIARQVAKRVKEQRGITLYWYECPYCGYWHLTKKERRNNDGKGNIQ